MIVERVFDKERIAKVLKDPEIFSRIAEDGIVASDYCAPDDAVYIMDEHDRGLMIYHQVNSITVECHVHVLKDHRADAYDFGQSAINWLWKNTESLKIVAQIPEIYPNVIKFALKNGFEIEGLNEGSYIKSGELYDQVYLGLMKNGVR